MSGQVSSNQQGAFTTPVNGASGDAAVVLGNDNALRLKYNAHDADATVHVQSSVLASRPAAGTAGRFWWTSDGLRLYYDTGAAWSEVAYVPYVAGIGTITGQLICPDIASNSGGTPLTLHNGATLVGTFSATAATLPFTLTVAGPVQKATGTTGSVANTAGAAIVGFASLADGAYLATVSQVGSPANKAIGLYVVGGGTGSHTQIATNGGLTLLTNSGNLELANNTGGAGTFTWAYVRLV